MASAAKKQEDEYAATYKFGDTTVHIIAPEPKPQEEIDRILKEFYSIGWEIIQELVARGEKV
jgi:hypothetical protein